MLEKAAYPQGSESSGSLRLENAGRFAFAPSSPLREPRPNLRLSAAATLAESVEESGDWSSGGNGVAKVYGPAVASRRSAFREAAPSVAGNRVYSVPVEMIVDCRGFMNFLQANDQHVKKSGAG